MALKLQHPGHAKLRIPTLVVGGIKSHIFGTIAANLRTEGFEVMWHWETDGKQLRAKKPPSHCRAVIILSDLIPHRKSVDEAVTSSGVPYIYTERKWAKMQQDLETLKKSIPEFLPCIDTPIPEKSIIRRRRTWLQAPENTRRPEIPETKDIDERLLGELEIHPEEVPPHDDVTPEAPLQEPEAEPMAAAPAEAKKQSDIPYDDLKQELAALLHSKDLTDLVEIMREKHFVTRVNVTIVPGERPRISIRREIEDTI